MSSYFFLSEFKRFELNVSVFIILHCFDFSAFCIFQYKAKLVFFQLATFKFLSEVEVNSHRNADDTFLSWFFWSLHCLRCWIVLVNDLACCIFNIRTRFNIFFNSSYDIKFIVATECEFLSI